MEETEAEKVKTRAEKRKERKKMKRKQIRKEVAEIERKIEEARLDDPEELKRLEREQEEEGEARERALKEFQDRERAWIEAMESKRLALALQQQQQQQEEEEKSKKDLEQKAEEEEVEDTDSEYVEGPAEIIWKGNEIIVRKKKLKVPKKDVNQITNNQEDADRPTSNPLPPQSEAFSDYLNMPSTQQVLDNVAKEILNFGTEKDKNHCPFHYKIGACRFGERCSRAHFRSNKSHTLLIKNMFDVPGLAWEQDEQLEFPDEEIERSYEEFYDDVHSEFLKYGEIVNFKVCRNSSSHLKGNVHYKSLESAVLAYQSINGRYFAKKQAYCEFVSVTKWRLSICGDFMKSGLKTCSRGMACNFIHCFRNPGGEYKWADWDESPPKYWQEKMTALFGYSVESRLGKEVEHDRLSQSRNSSKMIASDAGMKRSRRSRSTERRECFSNGSDKSRDNMDDVHVSTRRKIHRKDDRKHAKVSDERLREERRGYTHNYQNERSDDSSDGGLSDMDQVRCRSHTKKSSRNHGEISEYSTDNEFKKKGTSEAYDSTGKNVDRLGHRGHLEKSSRARSKWEFRENDGDKINRDKETNRPSHKSPKPLRGPGSPSDYLNSRHHSSSKTVEAGSHIESNHLDRWKPESPQRDLDRWSPEEEVHRRSKSRSRSVHKRSEKEAVSYEKDYKRHGRDQHKS